MIGFYADAKASKPGISLRLFPRSAGFPLRCAVIGTHPGNANNRANIEMEEFPMAKKTVEDIKAIIASLENAGKAVKGESGTTVYL